MTDSRTDRDKYNQHKWSAKHRGIEFDLTFEEWRAIWGEHLASRGVHRGQLNMCRARDEGGYRPGNVRIDTVQANHAEARASKTRRATMQAWGYDGHNGAESRNAAVERWLVFDNPERALRKKQEEPEDVDD